MTAANTSARGSRGRSLADVDARSWTILAALLALALFTSTFQTRINGSDHAYATDVGEIQNALPRWGLIHRSGYPLYTASGSFLVTLLRLVGVQPAAAASLVSVLWGAVAVGLFTALAQELGAPGPASVLGGLAVAVSTSMWAYASLAEVHTLTLAFRGATLLFAVRFGRTGERGDLLLLTLFFTQGVAHQRSVILLAPAVAVMAWPQLRAVWRGLAPAVGVSLLSPLTYLYMPLRAWTGASWVFGSPGTWEGFKRMMFDNRARRLFELGGSAQVWQTRLTATARTLADDLWWPLLILGLAGLLVWWFDSKNWCEGLAMMLAWVPSLCLTFIIWENRVGDAQLAAKLPAVAMAGVGLALASGLLQRWEPWLGGVAMVALALALTVWGSRQRPFLLSITRDASTEEVIAKAAQVAPPPDDRPTTLVAPWGHSYWALAYAQTYRGQLPGLNVVDHNANFYAIVERGDRLLVLDETLCVFPVSWWEDLLGRLHLASAAPGVIELSPSPPVTATDVPVSTGFELNDELRIRSAKLIWRSNQQLLLTAYWEVMEPVEKDYSVAVHLVKHDPPRYEGDVLAQADARHPVGGWYPVTRWHVGEIVRDRYVLDIPPDGSPVAVRVAMYWTDATGAFKNTRWLSLPVPER